MTIIVFSIVSQIFLPNILQSIYLPLSIQKKYIHYKGGHCIIMFSAVWGYSDNCNWRVLQYETWMVFIKILSIKIPLALKWY